MSRYEMFINKQKGQSEGTKGLGEFDSSEFLNTYEEPEDAIRSSLSLLLICHNGQGHFS